MGRKATLFLCGKVAAAATLGLVACAWAVRCAAATDPAEGIGKMVAAFAAPVVTAASVAALVLWLLRRRWLRALFAVAALALTGPYPAAMWRPWPCADEQGDLCVATWNVHGFRGEYGLRSAVGEAAALLGAQGVDIVCLEEFRASRDYDTAAVVRMLGLPYAVWDGSVAVLSRYPIVGSEPIEIVGAEGNTTNGALQADVQTPAGRVRVVACHLQTTGAAPFVRAFRRDYGRRPSPCDLARAIWPNACLRAEQVRRLADSVAASPWPVVWAGDFNDPPMTYTYTTAVGVARDAFREAGCGAAATFAGAWGLLRLDYVFVGPGVECVGCRRLKSDLSDHYPVVARLRIAPEP